MTLLELSTNRFITFQVFALVAAFLLFPPTVFAASITVGGECTLNEAIDSANGNRSVGGCTAGSGTDTIELTENISMELYQAPGRANPDEVRRIYQASITSDIVINGNGFTIDAYDGHSTRRRFFYISGGGNLTLNNVMLRGGHHRERGGAIHNDGHLTINNSILAYNYALLGGGAIYSMGHTTINDSSLLYNRSGIGGGIRANAGSLTVDNVTFLGHNQGVSEGGAIYTAIPITVRNSRFHDNYAGHFGGAINSLGRAVNVYNSVFTNNRAKHGGAIRVHALDGAMTVSGSYFAYNQGGNYRRGGGGAIDIIAKYGHGGSPQDPRVSILNVTNSRFNSNRGGNGGAIYIDGVTFTLNASSFIDNYANWRGGAIAMYWMDGHPGSSSSITNSTFHNNRSRIYGGAIHIVSGAYWTGPSYLWPKLTNPGPVNVDIKNSTFVNNSSTTYYNGSAINVSAQTRPDGPFVRFYNSIVSSSGWPRACIGFTVKEKI